MNVARPPRRARTERWFERKQTAVASSNPVVVGDGGADGELRRVNLLLDDGSSAGSAAEERLKGVFGAVSVNVRRDLTRRRCWK